MTALNSGNNTKKISVIIPAYNCAQYIDEALKSIFEQNYSAIEILVINDGSTDSTLNVLNKYGDRIQVINQENSGSAAARNVGLQRATGYYIAFLDSDDIWLEGKLSSQVTFLESHAEYDVVFSNWVCWNSNENGTFEYHDFSKDEIAEKSPVSGWLFEELIRDCIVWTSTVLMRRSVYEKIGLFDVQLLRGQDYDYWLRIAQAYKIHKLDNIYAVYRIHDQSITNIPKPTNYQYLLLQKAIASIDYEKPENINVGRSLIAKRLAETCFNFAYQHFYNGDILVAIKNTIISIKHDPKHLKSWIYLLASIIKLPFWMLYSKLK